MLFIRYFYLFSLATFILTYPKNNNACFRIRNRLSDSIGSLVRSAGLKPFLYFQIIDHIAVFFIDHFILTNANHLPIYNTLI